MSKISVCTSVLNQSDYLKRMIESVRAQTFTDWEHVIVDDGSTEDIRALVDSYDDKRIRYYRFTENRGIPHGLNFALEHALGEYLQPLSADEIIEPGKFSAQVEYLDANPGIGCVWGLPGKFAMGVGLRPLWEQNILRAHNRSREAWIRTLMRLENIPMGGATMMMRRSCYAEIGGFDPRFFACSDLEWFVRFFEKFEGRMLPYRWADADQPETRLTAPKEGSRERFAAELKLLNEVHAVIPPSPIGRVTVCIPCYNMKQFIGDTLASLAAQTISDFDIIVVDDGSTDGLELFGDPDKRVRFCKLEENQGTVAALNFALTQCETEFFCSVAADDMIAPDFIEKALAEFARDPWLEFVASQTDFVAEDGRTPVTEHPFAMIPRARNLPRETWLEQLYYGNQYFGVGMYRTSTLKEIGGWRKEFGVLTDYEMYLRLLQRENIRIIEENLTHTRIHSGNKSMLKPMEARQLKQLYHDARADYYAPRMKVIIATPFYEMRGFSPYIASMCATIRLLSRLNIEHEFWELSGDSYVDRAKNTLTNKFLEDPDATDLFIIDSDMQWDAGGFLKMLLLPEQIVMGSYPQKNAWNRWTSVPVLVEEDGKHHPRGRILEDGAALILSDYLAGGFIRMKRACLQKYKDHYKDYIYVDPSADSTCPERVYTEFYTCERKDNLRWGEDRVFGNRMKAIGIEAYIYPNMNFGHYGVKGWLGNFDHFLRNNARGTFESPEGGVDDNSQRHHNQVA